MRVSSRNSRSLPDLSKRITHAWELKINERRDEALVELAQLRQQLKIPPGKPSREMLDSLLQGDHAGARLATLLLSISLSRSSGDLHQSQSMLQHLEEIVAERGIVDFGYLCYEKGMRAFIEGDFFLAMECFTQWSVCASSPFLYLCAIGNKVFCMENLGLDYSSPLSEFMQRLPQVKRFHNVDRAAAQMEALKMREWFRCGKPNSALRTLTKSQSHARQSTYFQYWIESLPFHRGYRELTASDISELVPKDGGRLEYRAYRMRTLQGIYHPDDALPVRTSEFADRLYLWVWRWMVGKGNAQTIKMALEQFSFRNAPRSFTVEDRQLVRNALAWLLLFDPARKPLIDELISTFSIPTTGSYRLFSFEHLVIKYLFACREGAKARASELKRSLMSDPLWKSDQLCFRSLLDGHPPKQLGPLAEKLSEIMSPSGRNRTQAELIVDTRTGTILHLPTQHKTLSRSLALSLLLMKTKSSVSLEEFLSYCFGIRRYDPLIHNTKVYNLLGRMKALVGKSIRFRIRSGFIFSEGNWNHVEISGDQEPGVLEALDGLGHPVPASATRVGLPTWHGSLRRRDLETLLQLPRSTTNRFLSRWIQEGKVYRHGTGRSATYQVGGGLEIPKELYASR